MFNNEYQGKKVLVTGHTGFKGSWLATWLLKLGARVVGISKNIPTSPSIYKCLKISSNLNNKISYMENIKKVSNIMFANEIENLTI